jgi:hypothetical protein
MAWLDDSSLIEKTSLFGTAVHAVIATGSLPEQLRQALEREGRAVEAFERVVPSLEDVFLDVVDRIEKERAA